MKTFFLAILCSVSLFAIEEVNDSIVKIFATVKEYDYNAPWCPPSMARVGGSGFFIGNNQIITNAHMVTNASFIEVRSAGSQEKFEARVKIIGHDCDLALIEVEDETFFEGKKPLELSEGLLRQEEEVQVHGFPMGGSELSVTKGIVSRIEMRPYSHSGASLLITQIDAPINPGNSGGPVLSDGKVVGIAHQGYMNVQNIGYMIPVPIIRHFLEEANQGTYHGFPRSRLRTQSVRNPAMRKYYGLEKEMGGLLVVHVSKNHFLYGHLKKGDILLEIDGYPIDTSGSIRFDDLELTLPFKYVLMMKHFGDEVSIAILRDGERCEFQVTVDPNRKGDPLVSEEFDKPPTYYIMGGFVFQPLVENYLASDISFDENLSIFDLYQYLFRGTAEEGEGEVVVLSRVLDDIINVGYQRLEKKVVAEVNGQKIDNMKMLIAAFETCQEPYIHIKTKDNIEIVLDREAVLSRNQKILTRYFIPYDRSVDLR